MMTPSRKLRHTAEASLTIFIHEKGGGKIFLKKLNFLIHPVVLLKGLLHCLTFGDKLLHIVLFNEDITQLEQKKTALGIHMAGTHQDVHPY